MKPNSKNKHMTKVKTNTDKKGWEKRFETIIK